MTRESAQGQKADSPPDPMAELPALLGRQPDEEEAQAWAAMGPSHRRRTADRIQLMDQWLGDRGDLTAGTAAARLDVTPKYFYEMASAWKRTRRLSALGAFKTASPTRGQRLNADVVNAIQANVARIVRDAPEGTSVEAMRRSLEQAAAETLRVKLGTEALPELPSPRTIRTFIEREQRRVAVAGTLGNKLVFDCSPVSMRRADGSFHQLFSIIDRGTGIIIGHHLGDLNDSVQAYSRAAERAGASLTSGETFRLPWAERTERLDMTFGEDTDACRALLARYRAAGGLPELGGIENPKRYGRAYKEFVGDRAGRVQFRPTWLKILPPLEKGTETFDDMAAALRADADIAVYNREIVDRRKGEEESLAPENLIAALDFLARAGAA